MSIVKDQLINDIIMLFVRYIEKRSVKDQSNMQTSNPQLYLMEPITK